MDAKTLYLGIDLGVRSGAASSLLGTASGVSFLSWDSWSSWQGQEDVIRDHAAGIREALRAGLRVVVQVEGVFFAVRGGIPLNTDGIEDALQSMGAWRSMACRAGAVWCPPVGYSRWAGDVLGIRGKAATKKACTGLIRTLAEADRLPKSNEHKRDSYYIARWRADCDLAGMPIDVGERRVSRKAKSWRKRGAA